MEQQAQIGLKNIGEFNMEHFKWIMFARSIMSSEDHFHYMMGDVNTRLAAIMKMEGESDEMITQVHLLFARVHISLN